MNINLQKNAVSNTLVFTRHNYYTAALCIWLMGFLMGGVFVLVANELTPSTTHIREYRTATLTIPAGATQAQIETAIKAAENTVGDVEKENE